MPIASVPSYRHSRSSRQHGCRQSCQSDQVFVISILQQQYWYSLFGLFDDDNDNQEEDYYEYYDEDIDPEELDTLFVDDEPVI